MPVARTFAELQAVFAPAIQPVIVDGIEIGHIITHGQAQASAYDAAGRPVGDL